MSFAHYIDQLKKKLSRAVYASSQLSPFGIILCICLCFDCKFWTAGCVLMTVALSVILFYVFVSLTLKKNSQNASNQSIERIALCDSDIWPVLMTNIFLTTLATNMLFISQANVVVATALFATIVLFFLYSALVIPFNCHPCFLVLGFHFYKVTFEKHKEEYLLISKNPISDTKSNIRVVRLSDYVVVREKI